MPNDKTKQETQPIQHPPRKTLGNEELFDVFKADGGAEFFAKPTHKKQVIESETRTGPSIHHQINDTNGPTIANEMRDSAGPIIKKTELVDVNGPIITHHMSDAIGSVINRNLENTRVNLPTIPNPLGSITKASDANSNHQAENSTLLEQAHRMDTFSIHMAERIAKMKSAQKETREKMDELEANTNHIQVKPTPKGKK